jgi:hypothetical protein
VKLAELFKDRFSIDEVTQKMLSMYFNLKKVSVGEDDVYNESFNE